MSMSKVAALVDLVRRVGVLRHPLAVTRILRRHGGSLPAAIELGALRAPSHPAVAREREAFTYAQLRTALRATTAALEGRFHAGERVGVATDATAASLVLMAAAIAAGLDTIPLGSRLGAEDRELIVRREKLVAVLTPGEARWTSDEGRAPRARVSGKLLMLSSGSTGPAQTTERRALGLAALVPMADLDRRIRWPRGSVVVLPPLDHGHGLSAAIAGFLRGETVLLASALPAVSLEELARAHHPTVVTGVPLQLTRVVRAGVFDDAPLARIVSGSSRLDDVVAAELSARTGATVIDCLGTTETGTFAVRQPPAAFRPLAGVRFAVDGDGKLRVRSALTSAAVPTGDVGELRGQELTLHGRADGLVDSAGELISPGRVAEALNDLPEVHACEVRVTADELRGAVVTARVQVHGSTTSDQLRASLLPVLGLSGTPRRIDVVEADAQRP